MYKMWIILRLMDLQQGIVAVKENGDKRYLKRARHILIPCLGNERDPSHVLCLGTYGQCNHIFMSSPQRPFY